MQNKSTWIYSEDNNDNYTEARRVLVSGLSKCDR